MRIAYLFKSWNKYIFSMKMYNNTRLLSRNVLPQRLMKTGNLYQNIFITYRLYRIIFTGLVADKATNFLNFVGVAT